MRGILGEVAFKRGELSTAEEYLEKSLALFREIGNQHEATKSLTNLGRIAQMRGELAAAESYHNDSLSLERKLGDRHGEAGCLRHLGRLAQARDDFALAQEHFEEALGILREEEIVACALDSFVELIDVCEQQGATETAMEWCEQAIELADRTEQATERERFQERRSELVTTDEGQDINLE